MPNMQDVVAKATEALATSVASIVACDDDEETKREALAETFGQFEDYIMERNGGSDITKARRHQVGPQGLASAVTEHFLDMLDFRRRKLGIAKSDDKHEDTPMNDSVEKAVTDHGPYALAKALVDDQSAHRIDEHRFVRLITAYAKSKFPELTEPAAFQKVFLDDGEASRLLQKAHAICKAATANFDVMIADVVPLVVGGFAAQDEAMNNTESSEAYRQLQSLGQQRWPGATREQQFSRAFEANPELARKAHRTPVGGSTHYPMPNFDLLGSRR